MRTILSSRPAQSITFAILIAGIAGATGWAQPARTPAAAANATRPGAFWTEPPTLVSLGFEWRIAGDDNGNATVAVTYRKKGDTTWRPALPLVRLHGEQVGQTAPANPNMHPDPIDYVNPNMFAGSILNLDPDTTYECRFVLSDPDGVAASAQQRSENIVTVHTRKEPMPAAGGHVYHVYPIGWTGPKQEPAFTGLMEAYYQGAASSDFENTYPPRVQPGDVIVMHAGVYKSDRFHYLNGLPHPGYNALSTLFDGTYYLTQSGTADKPIVIKGAGDGEVVFDGDGAQTFFNLMAANYNYFEGLTFRNANLVFLLGIKSIAGASGFTLKHSKLENIGRGVQDDWSGSKNFYIADNVFIGRHDPKRMMGWNGAEWAKLPGFPETLGGPDGSEYAVKLYGQGHVVAYNYIANWHDGIDVATYGNPDGTPREIRDRVPVAIDFYNNDIFNMGDNCIETDGGAHNIRVFRNRCFNVIAGALSATPLIGGPAYFFQNVVYNTTTGGVLKYGTAANILTYQNTFIGDIRTDAPNQFFRNNLVLGGAAATPVFAISSFTTASSSDYNGFRPAAGADRAFEWNTPARGARSDFRSPIERRLFATLDEYRAATGQDAHSVVIDYDVFVKASMPDRRDIQRLYSPGDFDFSPAAGSAAIDAGIVLPTINDRFTGRAPDLGAYERGQAQPHYGPRPTPEGTR